MIEANTTIKILDSFSPMKGALSDMVATFYIVIANFLTSDSIRMMGYILI
jgi:hypothetical protein